MAQLPLLPAGPITVAVSPLLSVAPTDPLDAPALLAALLDLRAGVALGEHLSARAEVTQAEGGAPLHREHEAAAVRVRITEEIRGIEARLDDAFEHAQRPRYRLPNAARLYLLLQQTGALEVRSKRVVKLAARALWAPFDDFLETHSKRARFGLRDLRRQVAPTLAAMGPRAAALVDLDELIFVSTSPAVDGLHRRVFGRLEEVLAEHLRRALDVTGRGPGAEVPGVEMIGPWLEDDGLVRRALLDGQRFVHAQVASDKARLWALAHACLAPESP